MRGKVSTYRKQLLAWFRQHARALPWRTDPSLYRTVVSEFMLQQTQVDTVLPYFERWIKQFPDFQALAGAGEADVLKLWEGLGYYSRARNILKLARSIVEQGIPEDFDGWLKRPGIGPYTAAAISSISQGQAEPVIDGNVIRVLSRLFHDTRPIASASEARSRFLSRAKDLIDPDAPGDYNEAIMELGATVCRKVRPACLLCPVNIHCESAQAGDPESLPVIRRKASTSRSVARLWLHRDKEVLLQFHSQDANRLAGLAELPEIKSVPGEKPILVRSRGISTERIQESIFALQEDHPLARVCRSRKSTQWVPLTKLAQVPLSGPHKRWIQQLLEQEDNPS
jgi:A/G-specific adenine glycosylase